MDGAWEALRCEKCGEWFDSPDAAAAHAHARDADARDDPEGAS